MDSGNGLANAVNTLRPRQMDAISQTTFSNAFSWMKMFEFRLPKVPINNILAMVQIMAWCRPGDKPFSEPMVVSLPTHICVTRPQWVNQGLWHHMASLNHNTSNGSWCMGIKGEMSGTVCVTFTWYMYIYELFIAFVCFVVCSLL